MKFYITIAKVDPGTWRIWNPKKYYWNVRLQRDNQNVPDSQPVLWGRSTSLAYAKLQAQWACEDYLDSLDPELPLSYTYPPEKVNLR